MKEDIGKAKPLLLKIITEGVATYKGEHYPVTSIEYKLFGITIFKKYTLIIG